MTWEVRQGDCFDVLPTLADGSVDACVTDPPYGLEFMGKAWDSFGAGKVGAPGIGVRDTPWVSNGGWNALRCVKCGHLPHGGSPCRCADPDIRAADDRWPRFQVWTEAWAREVRRALRPGGYLLAFGGTRTYHRLACGLEDAGFAIQDCLMWLYGQGFPKGKTQLKPAYEPILLAYKPGKRVLNVDACRIEAEKPTGWGGGGTHLYEGGLSRSGGAARPVDGRWPANVVLDEEAAAMLDEQSGTLASGTAVGGLHRNGNKPGHVYGEFGKHEALGDVCYGDTGGASRFMYVAKAASGERHYAGRCNHPTVKPVDLMRWLCRLVTPKGGLILDPFTGSGSTGIAALAEGFRFLGIEREAEYVELARRRIAGPLFAEPPA